MKISNSSIDNGGRSGIMEENKTTKVPKMMRIDNLQSEPDAAKKL